MCRKYNIREENNMRIVFDEEKNIPMIFNYKGDLSKDINMLDNLYDDLFYKDVCREFYELCLWEHNNPIKLIKDKIVITIYPYIDLNILGGFSEGGFYSNEGIQRTFDLPKNKNIYTIKDILDGEQLRSVIINDITRMISNQLDAYRMPDINAFETYWW